MTIKNRFQLWLLKSEDPAKMTYSIPDFVSLNRTKTQVLPRILPRLRECLSKTQDQDLESCESRVLPTLSTGATDRRATRSHEVRVRAMGFMGMGSY